MSVTRVVIFIFFNDTATTEIYTLSLHDALPIYRGGMGGGGMMGGMGGMGQSSATIDRKSTRLNSSHANISYPVFCLKKKNSQPWKYFTPPLWAHVGARDVEASYM